MSSGDGEAIASFIWLGLFGVLLIAVGVFAFFLLPFLLVAGAIFAGTYYYYHSPSYKEEKARQHTQELYDRVKAGFGNTLGKEDFLERVYRALDLPDDVRDEFLVAALAIYEEEGFADLRPPPAICNSIEGARYRDYLNALAAKDNAQSADLACDRLIAALQCLASKVPNVEAGIFKAPIADLVGIEGEDVERFIDCFYDEDAKQVGLFKKLREIFDSNLAEVDILPSAYKGNELLLQYFKNTPFLDLFSATVPFAIPDRTRFEHSWILAGSGHGKTQTIQHILLDDFKKVARNEASVVVIDSQNRLLSTIVNLALFAEGGELHERLVWLNLGDVEYPLSANLFHVPEERFESYSMRERERLLNSLTELYEFVFRSLLSSPMTDRQSTLFQFLTRLMFKMEGSTIHTMVDFLGQNNLEGYEDAIRQLDKTAQDFFFTDYKKGAYKDTQQQVRNRLFAFLRSTTFDRMFSAVENKIDLFEELGTGKVILINTDKDLFKEGGSGFLGRFFIALLAQAIEERATVSKPLPTFVYIDEAEDYFDEQLPRLLSTVRKHNIGITLAHQFLEQIPDVRLRGALMANTSIKFAGGISPGDARRLADAMNTTPEFIREQPKGRFAAYVKGTTDHALSLEIPFFTMENMPKMSKEELTRLQDKMRDRYATHYSATESGNAEAKPEEDEIDETETVLKQTSEEIRPSDEL
jgi:hypothetical protein